MKNFYDSTTIQGAIKAQKQSFKSPLTAGVVATIAPVVLHELGVSRVAGDVVSTVLDGAISGQSVEQIGIGLLFTGLAALTSKKQGDRIYRQTARGRVMANEELENIPRDLST